MIICANCDTNNVDGTLYCDNCGAELPESAFSTSLFDSPATVDIEFSDKKAPRLVHQRSGEEILLPAKNEVIIGREDPVSGIFPDVDTTPFGGEEDGVSRQHVKISQVGTHYYVEDLNSVNNTFVNHEKVTPKVPVEIADGDEIILGRAKFVMHFN
ncbi:FHA domain-containing protein [candidate division KSB1 bacterium]|nr:FHA domain-containing protein [candidate division KSB1 bacterium]